MKKLSGKHITVPFARKLIGMGNPVSAFNRCVGSKLFGTHGNPVARREAFTKAAKECVNTRGR